MTESLPGKIEDREYKQLYYPIKEDKMWNAEVESILPYLYGHGVDVGCSNRSPLEDQERIDADPWCQPDVLAEVNALPKPDNYYDYLTALHVIEHIEDQRQCMVEWLRVIKPGGIIALVHPDVRYTGKQKKIGPEHPNYPWAIHHHERSHDEFLTCFAECGLDNVEIVASGEAAPRWSFFVILKKKKKG